MANLKVPEYTRRAQNNYMKKFDRVTINLPLGSKARIKQLSGQSVNAFVNSLVQVELDRLESEPTEG